MAKNVISLTKIPYDIYSTSTMLQNSPVIKKKRIFNWKRENFPLEFI